MQPIKHVSIPQPCHEDWQQMTRVAQGRHCQSCCKTVIDFTAMSNAEVINYLAMHKNTCGRIEHSRLAGINYELEADDKRLFSWKGLLAAASLSILFPAIDVQAQIGPKIEQLPYASFPRGKMMVSSKVGSITIEGKVTAKEDGQPIPGVSIIVKGISTGTKTTADGSFKLKLLNVNDTIRISSVSYKPVEMPVGHGSKAIDISLEIAPIVLNDVLVQRYASSTRQCSTLGVVVTLNGKKIPFYLRWWYWLVHKARHIIAAINPF
ncbi:carboxypeptidase-like regulatory domain-containing protein [Mucilaginibacter sp. ZT4R22]|uniref:Carboxypeptidase-like regulatory domain-containing protein n=1 Tax=Mucilaginibacter pankratovii TaxID=2772110 RepID=A0ABR7WVT2_9SPHI|nr:carboxypeptidase-like regulatory domain-containing protein [Mucilaginibacter pankratovii]MBD1366399.1 carboxypeptidase-like regulatory domain-containing protein [Mucilaginibacter pankratovii]